MVLDVPGSPWLGYEGQECRGGGALSEVGSAGREQGWRRGREGWGRAQVFAGGICIGFACAVHSHLPASPALLVHRILHSSFSAQIGSPAEEDSKAALLEVSGGAWRPTPGQPAGPRTRSIHFLCLQPLRGEQPPLPSWAPFQHCPPLSLAGSKWNQPPGRGYLAPLTPKMGKRRPSDLRHIPQQVSEGASCPPGTWLQPDAVAPRAPPPRHRPWQPPFKASAPPEGGHGRE